MIPTATLDNHNPPATNQCCLKPSPKCREKSDTPQGQLAITPQQTRTRPRSLARPRKPYPGHDSIPGSTNCPCDPRSNLHHGKHEESQRHVPTRLPAVRVASFPRSRGLINCAGRRDRGLYLEVAAT